MSTFQLDTAGTFNNHQTTLRISQSANGRIQLLGEFDTAFLFVFEKKPVVIFANNAEHKISKMKCEIYSAPTRINIRDNSAQSKLYLLVKNLKIHYKAARSNIGRVEFYLTNLSFFYLPEADNTININGINFRFELLHNQLGINKYLKNNRTSLITTKITVENIKNITQKRLSEIVYDIAYVCSFACGNRVGVARIEVYDKNNGIKSVKLFDEENDHITDFPLINIAGEPGLFKRCIEASITPYQQYKNKLLLASLIDLLFLTKRSSFIEQRMLTLANFLEVVRFNFADNIAVPSGQYTKNRLDFFRNGRRMSFEGILADFFRSNRTTGWQSKYKDMRNEIIHTGKIKTSSNNKLKDILKLQEFCERILLGILNWDRARGKYLSSSCPVIPRKNIIGPNYLYFKR